MSVTIDSLQIEIQSNSTNAASGIDSLAKALKKLNKNSDINNAVTSLNNLRKSLHAFVNMPSNASKIESLARSLKSLSKVGKIDIGTSLDSVRRSMESLGAINVESVAPQIERIAGALTPLNDVKGSGFNAMMNGLKKLDDVVAGLDSGTIDRFAEKMKELDEKLGPVSTKLVAIGNAFKVMNSGALTASGGLSVFGGSVNTTTLNLQSMISVARDVWSTLQPVINLLKNTVSEAIEWDGIASRFGRGFGSQASEVYEWVQRLNKEMGLNTQQFMQYSSVFSTMLQGFGVGLEDSTQMALGYTELVYDIWAGYNDIYKSFGDAAEAVKSAIAGEVEPIRRAGFTIVESTLEQTAANHGLKISLEKATEEQKSYLRYLTLVDQAHAQNLVGTYAKELTTAEGLMRTFRQQLTSLAQTFGSVFLPVLVKVMPWLQAFIDLLGEAIRAVAGFFNIDIQEVNLGKTSGLDGVSDAAKEAEKAVGGTKNALKELKNATLGIDELNVISPPDESAGAGGAGSSPGAGFGGLDVGSLWDESIFDQIQFEVDAIKERLKEALSGIEALISGFALAVGTILAVSGANVPLGLGLMAIGAVGLAHSVAANWNEMSDQLAKTLTTVTSVVGGFLLAVGAVLAFGGVNVGLGVGLMAAGAVSLGTAVAINWKFLEGDFKNTLSILTGIVSGGLLAMGALFAFTGVDVPLGVGLMLAGAVGLATAAGLNWDSMSEPMRKAIGTLEAIVGGGLLTFGAILALTGANVPLGVGMIAAGAVSLVSAATLNWNSMTGEMKNRIATITALVSGALLGIGAVLAFTGVATPLGISMMAAGAVGIVGSAAINWESVVNSIKNVLKEIGIAVGAALLALGILLVCTGVALPTGIALIAVGAASLVAGVALNWSAIVSSVKNVLKEIGIVAGAAMLALGVLLVCTGVGIPLGIGLIAAGATSLAAGVALNWDSIKTSIQKAINAIGDWLKKYGLLALGAVLCLTGAGVPMGIALIKQGLGTQTGNGSTVGDELLKTLKEKWNAVKEWWNSKPALKEVSVTIGNIKTKVSNAWSSAKTWWDKTKSAMSTYTPNIGSVYDTVKTRWNTAKKWWSESKGSLSTYTPSIGSIQSKLSSAWSSAKTWWSNKKGSLSYTPTIGSIQSKLSSAWSSAKKWWNDNVKLSIPSLSFKVTYVTKGLDKWQQSIVDALDLKGWPRLTFAADGGIFNTGSLIWAGESGPEVLANAGGGKTGVMNTDQMQAAVYEGVYAAVTAAMRASGGNSGGAQSVNVYLDSRQITASVEQRQRERGAAIMGNQVYAY